MSEKKLNIFSLIILISIIGSYLASENTSIESIFSILFFILFSTIFSFWKNIIPIDENKDRIVNSKMLIFYLFPVLFLIYLFVIYVFHINMDLRYIALGAAFAVPMYLKLSLA